MQIRRYWLVNPIVFGCRSLNSYYHLLQRSIKSNVTLSIDSLWSLVASHSNRHNRVPFIFVGTPYLLCFAPVDSKFGIKPEFISTFETRDHVYTIYTEPALETYNLLHQKSVYSRIARVCKNDMGASEDEHIFMTLFKARLLCGLPEVSDGKGSYPFYFDEVGTWTSCPYPPI